MRHRNSGRKLGRTSSHRKAMFRNMTTALLNYGRITTTEAKAKEVRSYIEPVITLAQTDSLHTRREAYRFLGNHKLVKRLFDDIGPLFKGVNGGYTRIVRLAMPRKGDCAPMVVIELLKGAHFEALGTAKADSKKTVKTETEETAEKPVKASKPKAAPKTAGAKASSQVASTKPKSTPRKAGG